MTSFVKCSKVVAYCILGLTLTVISRVPVLADLPNEDGKAKPYNKDLFYSEVTKKNHFVMFYAPWCTHCKRLSPLWEELAQSYNSDENNQVTVAKVDCTVDTELCSAQDVTGYPTLKFYKANDKEENAVKFRGSRDLPTLTSFINTQLGIVPEGAQNEVEDEPSHPETVGGLTELTDKSFDSFVENGNHFVKFYAPWCGHCQKLAPTWDELAKSFETNDKVKISKVDCTQHKTVCSKYDVKSYPTMLWIQNGKKVDTFRGHRTIDDLRDFVLQLLGTPPAESTTVKETVDVTMTPVISLTRNNFKENIDTGVTFVKFFAPWCGHCKRLAPAWEELAKKFLTTDRIKIARVDCTQEENKQLCNDEEVDGYPTLFLYRNGEKISEHNGSRSVEDLLDFLTKHTQHDEL